MSRAAGRSACATQIAGQLDVPSYLAFIAERAHWLDISGWAMATNEGVTLVAAGPEALVGALEMACTLGPLDALVDQHCRCGQLPSRSGPASSLR